ncbi:MAG: M14 family metallopeptidase [Rhizomicrobium sp.]
MRASILTFLLLLLSGRNSAAADWTTPAEASQFRATPSYAETLSYLKRLERAAPGKIRLENFGVTPQGRKMTVVIANGRGVFTPDAARKAKMPIILLQAGIHPGEIEGKDAGLMLLRDFAVGGRLSHLLDHVLLVYIPVFSVDGHENSSPYYRINQNGPESMGFRGQAQYLNLNRDYVKADSPEMRGWLRLWQRWSPDFLIDIHTTDGADYQYDLTWYLEDPHKLDAAVSDWQHAAIDHVVPQYEGLGHLASPYLEFKDGSDPRKGIENFGSGPRFSTGYAALRNRPALLIETHMLKSYETRVRATYDLIQLLLTYVDQQSGALLAAVAKADADTIARAPKTLVPLTFATAPTSTPFSLKGYAFTVEQSEVSNKPWIKYDPATPVTYSIENWNDLQPDISIATPAAYAIPAQWKALIDKLDAHGIVYWRTARRIRVRAQSYQLDAPLWAASPFESHLMLRDFQLTEASGERDLSEGTVIVPLNQPAANVAIQLLEPQAPDSLLHWGFLDAVFETKEYGEPRVLEKLARDMLAKDPALAAEFRKKLQNDPVFAASGNARLNFFFQRSPWYAVQRVGAYPVLRLDSIPPVRESARRPR